MADYLSRTNIRFETKKDRESVRRAARLLRVSMNRFMSDALVEKAKKVISAHQPQNDNPYAAD